MNDGTQRELRAEQIFLNVGTRNAQPPIDGLDSVPALDSTSIMELDVVPEHLIVLGGGYIGMEFSQMFRRFGSGVTVIQRGPQLLPREDADIGAEVANILRDDGITVLINTEAQHVEQAADGGIILTAQSSAGEHTVRGSHLLVATGRRPNTDLLNVEAAGLETDKKGTLTVNDRLETNVPGIYAMGDVKGGPAFTHISYDDFRVVKTNVLDGGSASIAGRMVPYTVFIDPQLGRIGLTEQQAREQGYNIRVAKLPMSSVARAIEVDETRGMMKAVVDADSEQILGAAILGLEGGEVVNVLQVAMMGQLPYTALRDGVLPHPTLSESLNNLFTTLEEG
jgi:pyruvate/2-oxoglutarate dehydrogenase complex dihydrolipoamide dehydrogenase (E3) component